MASPISGPTPPYSNPPINPQYYIPSRFVISNVSLGQATIVTTSIANNYVVGQQCRLIIPQEYGCRQLNEATGYVIFILSPTEIILNIDSSGIDAFVNAETINQPQILAIGDINSGIISSTGTVSANTTIPGAFKNISPL